MTTLTSSAAPSGFGYAQAAEVKARITASNSIGYGTPGPVSTTQTILAQVAPLKPPATPRRAAGTAEAQIVVEWDPVVDPANGGSAATSYNLQWDQGTGTFGVDLTGVSTPSLATTYTQPAVVAGGTYRFRYRASNKYGWGPFSDVLVVAAAAEPGEPAAPVTSITDIFVKLHWVAPDPKGSPLTEYEILIRTAAGTFLEEATYCRGSLSAVVESRYCHVPMTVLRAAPYSLQYGALVVAKLRARNAVGWGPYSPENSVGALVQTEPVAAATPAPTRGSRTDHTKVEVTWAAMTLPADTGGSAITSYNLQWNQGDGSSNFVDLAGQPGSDYLSTSYLLVAGVVEGRTYRFRLRARNKWGTGGFGAEVSIQASTTPGQVPAPPVTAIDGTNVKITW
jgi:antitoxin (DNA-binding transcriptional repressor) of toxin-antitoxin stability system